MDNYELKKALKDIDTVVHLATVSHPTEHHYIEQVNHWGTANICNLIEENPIKKFVFGSTAEIYGTSSETITIETEENPQTPFAKSMLRAENYVKTLQKKCEVAIIRTASCYGYNPAMDCDSGLNKHFFEAKYNNLLQLDADGLHTQSSVHIDDLAKLLHYIILQKSEQEKYLIATEQWSGMKCYEKLKTVYPDLEATFTSHHLRLQDNLLQSDAATQRIIGERKQIEDAINEFHKKTNL